MTAAYFEDTDRLGLGRPDAEPLATETIDGIVALIADLIEGGHAYESGGDVYFRVRSFDGYGKLSNRRTEDMDQGEEAGSALLKEDRLDFALWKARKEGEDTLLGLALGPRAAGLAHRVLGDGRAGAGRLLRDPRRRLGPRLPPPRERDRPVGGGRAAVRARLDAQRDGRGGGRRRCRNRRGTSSSCREALDRYGREAVVAYLVSGHYRQPLAFGAERMEEAVAQVEGLRNFFREHPVGESGEDSPEQQRGGSVESPGLPDRAPVRGVP